MIKRIVAIGGGELRENTTEKIDEYLVSLAHQHAGELRPCALFIPTASHDCMPYYNTFHKVYTGKFNVKTDVLLLENREIDLEKVKGKFEKADLIYVGGGDTVFMMETWEKTGILPFLKDAYERGVPLAGLSAGAICWFKEIYTDSLKTENGNKYAMFHGLGWVDGIISPHYNERMLDFDPIVCYNNTRAYGVENDAAMILEDGKVVGSVSSGGNAYEIIASEGGLQKRKI